MILQFYAGCARAGFSGVDLLAFEKGVWSLSKYISIFLILRCKTRGKKNREKYLKIGYISSPAFIPLAPLADLFSRSHPSHQIYISNHYSSIILFHHPSWEHPKKMDHKGKLSMLFKRKTKFLMKEENKRKEAAISKPQSPQAT